MNNDGSYFSFLLNNALGDYWANYRTSTPDDEYSRTRDGHYATKGDPTVYLTYDGVYTDWYDAKFSTHPMEGYIDAGFVLSEGITITREDFNVITTHEWHQLEEWVNKMGSSIIVNEVLPNKLLYICSGVPCITSMGEAA